ncbi:MAG: alpha/beta hydrolase-fold protein [Lysobacterales bacterium]
MNPQIENLFRGGAPGADKVAQFIHDNRFPLVEPGHVTFVFQGHADKVNLRRWISGLSTAQSMQSLEGTGLWVLRMELPDKSRFEYKFETVRNGHHELVLDKLNGVIAHDPFGANSVCQGYGYKRPSWTLPQPGTRSGTLTGFQVDSQAFDSRRDVQVYLPARFRRSRSYPLMVVHDGADYLRYADFKTVLDNLIHRLEIPAMIVALTQSPDRLVEYTGDQRHARFIGEELLYELTAKFPLIDTNSARGLMGASLGGVASLHTARQYPNRFGQLLLQSGSFAFSDLGQHQKGPIFDPVVRFVNEYRKNPFALAEKIYMSCGIYESLIYENRSLVPLLQAQGMQVKFEEARDAHNWENWRDRLRTGLSWLFPGPLWMVYE